MTFIGCFCVNSTVFANDEKSNAGKSHVFFQSKYLDVKQKVSSQPIRFSVADSWAEPYAFYDDKNILIDGVIKDFIEALARKLDSPYEHVYLPRKRMDEAAEKKQFDLRCYANESWVSKPELYNWTKPLFFIHNSIVWKKGQPSLNKITDLNGQSIGTVHGYSYSSLDSLFDAKKITRVDTTTEPLNIAKLEKNRISYAIVEMASFDWYVKTEEIDSLKSVDSFIVDKFPVKCGLLKSSSIELKNVESAILKLENEGFFRRLVVKYNLK